ncbi:hypothetical protein F5884DRAFT_824417 [Xylogone sp. PMI_703]|nr:hypothetical protein F5884DRAFT_824417 [Xylogone sp. PMI_703]
MGNAGRRSKCCFTCRQRRVKCDLQKPYCQRCTLAGRPCLGYPEHWDITLRMRIWRARGEAVPVPRGLHITAEVHSWHRFHRDYAMHSGIPVFNLLSKFYTSSSSTCFQEALQAVTVVSSARQLHQSGLMLRGRQHYGKAIAALNITLNDPVLTADDSVLMALFLLSLFEYFRKDADFQCHIHFRGALLLLQWRAERGRDSELDKGVFTFLSHICLMSMFMNNEPFDVKWLAFESFVAPWTKCPLLEPILDRVIGFMKRAYVQVILSHRPSRTEMIQLIKDGIAISEDLNTTTASLKSSSNPDLPSRQQPTAFNHMFEVSTKTTEAIARSLYQTVSYHVVELVSSLVAFVEEEEGDKSHSEPDYQFEPSMGSMILEQICSEICAVLECGNEHHMEEDQTGIAYRAYGLFWPLLVLRRKRAWAQEKLQFIGEISGLGIATWAARSINTIRSA